VLMSLISMDKSLPELPDKRYFTIGEVSDLCGVKPYVLRYWEQEFTQLKPMKRRGNRRYYQPHEVLLIRRIRSLLYDEGFTISGARNRLADGAGDAADEAASVGPEADAAHAAASFAPPVVGAASVAMLERIATNAVMEVEAGAGASGPLSVGEMRHELISIRGLLGT